MIKDKLSIMEIDSLYYIILYGKYKHRYSFDSIDDVLKSKEYKYYKYKINNIPCH